MKIFITKMILGEVQMIEIPTDTIFITSLLIIFALIVYFFNKVVNNETSNLAQKNNFNCNLELEDNLTLPAKILDKENIEKTINKKINIIPISKFLKISSLAFFTMGGVSLLGLQHMQKTYQGMNARRSNIKLESQSKKIPLSILEIKSLNKTQDNLKKINYIDPFLQTTEKSKANHFYQVREKQKESYFSF